MSKLRCGHDREALMPDGRCDACADAAYYGESFDAELHRLHRLHGYGAVRRGVGADEVFGAERREQRQW